MFLKKINICVWRMFLFLFLQHTQFVLDAAREKRDMEQRHAAIKKKVIHQHKMTLYMYKSLRD